MSSEVAQREIVAHLKAIEGAPVESRPFLTQSLISTVRHHYPHLAPLVARLAAALTGDATSVAQTRRVLGDVDFDSLSSGPQDAQSAGDTTAPWSRWVGAIDCLVFNVKKNELIGTLAAFDIAPESAERFSIGAQNFYLARHNARTFAITHVGRSGNSETSVALLPALMTLKPRAAALVGMAAGDAGQGLKIGDVIVANWIVAYDFHRLTRGGAVHEPRIIFSSEQPGLDNFSIDAPAWSRETWKEAIKLVSDKRHKRKIAPNDVSIRFGALLAGSSLIEDGSLVQLGEELGLNLKSLTVLGAEMEGAGFALACSTGDTKLPWVVVRGVADYGDADDEDSRPKQYQAAVTFQAARFLRDALDKNWIHL